MKCLAILVLDLQGLRDGACTMSPRRLAAALDMKERAVKQAIADLGDVLETTDRGAGRKAHRRLRGELVLERIEVLDAWRVELDRGAALCTPVPDRGAPSCTGAAPCTGGVHDAARGGCMDVHPPEGDRGAPSCTGIREEIQRRTGEEDPRGTRAGARDGFQLEPVSSKPKAKKSRAKGTPANDPIVVELFDRWRDRTGHKGAKLDAKRARVIAKAIESHGRETCELAIDGLVKSPWHMGQNDDGKRYDGVHNALGDAERIERFAELAKAPASTGVPTLRTRGTVPHVPVSDFSDFDFPETHHAAE